MSSPHCLLCNPHIILLYSLLPTLSLPLPPSHFSSAFLTDTIEWYWPSMISHPLPITKVLTRQYASFPHLSKLFKSILKAQDMMHPLLCRMKNSCGCYFRPSRDSMHLQWTRGFTEKFQSEPNVIPASTWMSVFVYAEEHRYQVKAKASVSHCLPTQTVWDSLLFSLSVWIHWYLCVWLCSLCIEHYC